MNRIDNYKQLGYAVAVQAAKDYKNASKERRDVIIKDLRSDYMDFITGGLSIPLADALINDHKAVIKRITNMETRGRKGVAR